MCLSVSGVGVPCLHQNEETREEEQRGPLHAVQDDLKVLDVCQDQQPQRAQDGDPAWTSSVNKHIDHQ